MKATYKVMATVLFLALLLLSLLLPQPACAEQQVYRVQPGDTLFSIAEKNGVSLANLLSSNQYLRFPNYVVGNQLLVLPGTEKGTGVNNVPQETGQPQSTGAERAKQENAGTSRSIVQAGSGSAGPGTNGGTSQISSQRDKENSTPENPNPEKLNQEKFSQEKLNQEKLNQKNKKAIYFGGASKSNLIALTFDDGPADVTCNQVMDILGQYNVKGTFFLVGQYINAYPQVVARMVREGHVVAGHSWSHGHLEQVSPEQVISEVSNTADAICQVTGLRPALFRPPYGSIDSEAVEYLEQNGYHVVNWSVDSVDWKYPDNGNEVVINVLRDVRGGSIILFHTPYRTEPSKIIRTVLPDIISSLQSQGYKFVTVDELLSVPAYK